MSKETLSEQLATLERQAIDRMKTSVNEATRLTMDALDYAAALSAHWRTTALDLIGRISEAPAP